VGVFALLLSTCQETCTAELSPHGGTHVHTTTVREQVVGSVPIGLTCTPDSSYAPRACCSSIRPITLYDTQDVPARQDRRWFSNPNTPLPLATMLRRSASVTVGQERQARVARMGINADGKKTWKKKQVFARDSNPTRIFIGIRSTYPQTWSLSYQRKQSASSSFQRIPSLPSCYYHHMGFLLLSACWCLREDSRLIGGGGPSCGGRVLMLPCTVRPGCYQNGTGDRCG
jgi:hypothetical protein